MDSGIHRFSISLLFCGIVNPCVSNVPMIVSHKYRFIFLKTAKTAGTSIEIALSKFVGAQDIVTPISAPDEAIRQRLGHCGPQNFRVPLSRHNALEKLSAVLIGRRKKFYNHMPAEEARSLVGNVTWSSYFKFCFERNPFDRVISLYYWCHKSEPRPSLAKFLEGPEVHLLTQRGLQLYSDSSGNICVDRVGRYENLNEELEEIRLRIGLPESLQLPMAKAAHRTDRRHYREVIDSACREKIEKIFSRELSLWNYQF